MNHPDPSPTSDAAPGVALRFATFILRPSIGQPSRATLLVRLAVGWVFVCSGVLKFLFQNQGPLRFAKIGLAAPTELAYFVGATEVVCGALLILGFLVRVAALPLVIDMMVAIVTTKIPLLFGAGPEPVAASPKTGFWAFAYQSRLDVTMLSACVFLVISGAGLWSLDALLSRRRWEGRLMDETRLGHGALRVS
jgi:putative oxidoreductase